jgi:hypothetical protein
MSWEAVASSVFETWLLALDHDSYKQVMAAIIVLQEEGPALGRPLVDRVKSSRFHNMKELRPGSEGRTEIRVLFAFDPARHAVLLLGGNKQGKWEKWYKTNVPVADNMYERHLRGELI